MIFCFDFLSWVEGAELTTYWSNLEIVDMQIIHVVFDYKNPME